MELPVLFNYYMMSAN